MAKKIEIATALFREKTAEAVAAGKTVSRKDMISYFMDHKDLKMTDAGASTYYHNVQKIIKTEDALKAMAEDIASPAPAETTAETESAEGAESTSEEVSEELATLEEPTELEAEVSTEVMEATPESAEEATSEEKPAKKNKKNAAPESVARVGCKVVSEQIDEYLASIDLNEIPLFLRK